jgi:hypothetical protein
LRSGSFPHSGEVIMDGANRNAQMTGNLPRGKPVRCQLQDRYLTGSQELLSLI